MGERAGDHRPDVGGGGPARGVGAAAGQQLLRMVDPAVEAMWLP